MAIGGPMMIALSCLFIFLGSNGVFADNDSLFAVKSSRKASLRHASGFQQSQEDVPTTPRYLEESSNTTTGEPSTSNGLEKTIDEGGVTGNETEALESTERTFGGDSNNETRASEDKVPVTLSTSAAEESENIDDKDVQVTENQETEGEGKTVTNGIKPTEAPKSETESPTRSPVVQPTAKPVAKPTAKPYTSSAGDYDPVKAEDEKHAEEEEVQELETELKQEEKVARQAGGLGIFLGIVAMIFTAHQMSENPDGIYASVCRLAITISSVIVKIICMPCRKLVGAGGNGHYNGHMPISTSDYSYRNDPYRSNANAGFEMS